MMSAAEEMCDPLERNCKTLTYVYEAPCDCCSGSGWTRGGRAGQFTGRGRVRNGRSRASLHVCLHCHGMGHVRMTSPQDPAFDSWDTPFYSTDKEASRQGKRGPLIVGRGPKAEEKVAEMEMAKKEPPTSALHRMANSTIAKDRAKAAAAATAAGGISGQKGTGESTSKGISSSSTGMKDGVTVGAGGRSQNGAGSDGLTDVKSVGGAGRAETARGPGGPFGATGGQVPPSVPRNNIVARPPTSSPSPLGQERQPQELRK